MIPAWTAALAATLIFGMGVAEAAWMGADDLPAMPLACGRDPGEPSAPPRPYDGGVPQSQPPRAGEKMIVLDVPRLTGVGYYALTARGMREAATELGNVEVKTAGATQISIAQQITFIEDYLSSGVDGVLFAANDPIAIAPVLKKALAAGKNVVGYDWDSSPDARQWFVKRVEPNGVAKALIDALAREAGDEAGFAIVTSTFADPVQARWIAEMSAYAAKCHPGLRWFGTVEAKDDPALARTQAANLLRRYGADLDAVIPLTNSATPAVATAIAEAGKCGEVAIVGTATPNVMKPHVVSGCVKSVVLWNPVDLGYAALHVLRAAADGTLEPGATSVKAGRLGTLRVDGSEVLLGMPYVFTAENMGGFDF